MKKKLSIRDRIYIEDLKQAAKIPPSEKLMMAIELSDFCRKLQSRALAKRSRKINR